MYGDIQIRSKNAIAGLKAVEAQARLTKKAVEGVGGRVGAGQVSAGIPAFRPAARSAARTTATTTARTTARASSDPLMAAARSNGVRLQAESAGRQAVLTSQLGQQQKARQAVLKRQNVDEIARLKTEERQKNAVEKNRAVKSERRREFVSNAAPGVLAGIGALAAGAAVALAAAKENINANRALSSTATEAGKSYGDLAIAAANYGKAGNVSATDAAKQTAGLQRLLTTAGKSDELEKYQKGFLDVAAARGINPAELTDLFQQIASGQDEALNRLGKADPGVLKEIYAKKHGLVADNLTQAQAVQSRLDAFEPDFDLFAGANADKLGSFSGQADLASKSIADITTNVGLAIAQNTTFQESLASINYLLGELAGLKPIDIVVRLKQGESVEKLAEEQADSWGNVVARGFKTIAGAPAAIGLYGYDAVTQGFETADRNFNAQSYTSKRAQDIDKLKPQIQKEKDAIDKQEFDAAKQFTASAQKRVDDANKAAAEAAKKARSTSYKRQVKYDLKDAKQNVGKLQAVLGSVQKTGLLKEDEKADLVADIEDRIESAKERLIQAQREVRSIVANTTSTITGSPVAAMFDDAKAAIEGAYDKFKDFDVGLARTAANATRLSEAFKMGKAAFESGASAVDYRQQAARERFRRPDEMNGFGRRLGGLEQTLDFAGQAANYRSEARGADFYANLNLRSPQNNPADIERNERLDKLDDYDRFVDRSSQLRGKFGKLGIEGEGAIAAARLSAMTPQSELVENIQNAEDFRGDYSARGQDAEALAERSREGLAITARLNRTLAARADKRLQDQIEKNAVVQQTTLPFAQQKLDQLNKDKGLLNRKDFLDQFLAITGELGDEITPELSKARVSVLEARGAIEEKNRKELIVAINNLGVIFKDSENVVFINNAKESATVNRKPKAADVAKRYGK